MDFSQHIREIPDFPKPGIGYKDITPLLGDATALRGAVDALADRLKQLGEPIDCIAGPEARGFIFASALAYRLDVGFVPIRKPGKLSVGDGQRRLRTRIRLGPGRDAH